MFTILTTMFEEDSFLFLDFIFSRNIRHSSAFPLFVWIKADGGKFNLCILLPNMNDSQNRRIVEESVAEELAVCTW